MGNNGVLVAARRLRGNQPRFQLFERNSWALEPVSDTIAYRPSQPDTVP